MNKLLPAFILMSACGLSQRDNETVAYVKHVTNETPILCYNVTNADLDLRTPGTMTSEKVSFTVLHESDANLLRKANETGVKVKVTSDEVRMAFCTNQDVITKVELLPN